MATPTKAEIEEKAIAMFFLDQNSRGFKAEINPTSSELRESGYTHKAKTELMRNEGYEALDYIEKEARSLGYELVKSKETHYSEDLATFPLENILREGCFVTGGRGSGKSNLLKLLVQRLLCEKGEVKVKIFDPSLTWKSFPLPRIKVTEDSKINSKWNCIFDISRLSVLEARDFVSEALKRDLEEAIILTDSGIEHKALVVIEEAQNILPSHSLRTKKYLNLSRFVTQGRNFGLSFVMSTQRLSSVDVNIVELSGVRYWFKLEGHRNLSKARWWLPKFTVFRLRDLEIGQCYVQSGSKIKLLRLPLFRAEKVIAQ